MLRPFGAFPDRGRADALFTLSHVDRQTSPIPAKLPQSAHPMPKTSRNLLSAAFLALLVLCIAVPLTIWLIVMIKALGIPGAVLVLVLIAAGDYLFGRN